MSIVLPCPGAFSTLVLVQTPQTFDGSECGLCTHGGQQQRSEEGSPEGPNAKARCRMLRCSAVVGDVRGKPPLHMSVVSSGQRSPGGAKGAPRRVRLKRDAPVPLFLSSNLSGDFCRCSMVKRLEWHCFPSCTKTTF